MHKGESQGSFPTQLGATLEKSYCVEIIFECKLFQKKLIKALAEKAFTCSTSKSKIAISVSKCYCCVRVQTHFCSVSFIDCSFLFFCFFLCCCSWSEHSSISDEHCDKCTHLRCDNPGPHECLLLHLLPHPSQRQEHSCQQPFWSPQPSFQLRKTCCRHSFTIGVKWGATSDVTWYLCTYSRKNKANCWCRRLLTGLYNVI